MRNNYNEYEERNIIKHSVINWVFIIRRIGLCMFVSIVLTCATLVNNPEFHTYSELTEFNTHNNARYLEGASGMFVKPMIEL